MTSSVLKAAPNMDLYGLWSHTYREFTAAGTRDYMLRYLQGARPNPGVLNEPEGRLARADAYGTSTVEDHGMFGDWGSEGFAMRRGFLPRARLTWFLSVWDERNMSAAYALLEPLED